MWLYAWTSHSDTSGTYYGWVRTYYSFVENRESPPTSREFMFLPNDGCILDALKQAYAATAKATGEEAKP